MKLHAEQLTLQHGAALAAHYHALSADHLEYLCDRRYRRNGTPWTAAVLLPGAYYFLREKQLPPLDLLRQYRVPIALRQRFKSRHLAGVCPCV
ncbi:Imidazolonepropionase [Klebsiella pneumoniae]|uniref:Imidazolonepropionase n=1 Tax=Klebsiella pneumoniae TaxID=573 RepID=A0A378H339_KLEPN|nr:Imidazolonepropionase [Klebsiella pneumoniae]